MNSTTSSMFLTPKIIKSPELIGILGIFAVIFFGSLGIRSWIEFKAFSEQPEQMTLADASTQVSGRRLWVVLDDVQWNCQYVYYREIDRDKYTYIIFTNPDRTVWGVAFFSKQTTCDEVAKKKPIGVLEKINKQLTKFLADNNVDVAKFGSGEFLQLCTFCGRDNSRLGVIVSAIMVAIGIILQAIAYKAIKSRKRVHHFMKRNILRS